MNNQIDDRKYSLEIDTARTQEILVGFLRSEFEKTGFSRAVIGLSGGIDSSVACLLTAEALGAQNVLAVRMPYKTSSSTSLEHAGLIVDMSGVNEITIPITDMVDPLIQRFPDADPIRKGNMMARARMIILYDQSAAFGGLVIGTGNKTEILLGYTTLYGDSACALNPVGDLYKTQLRQLAAHLGVPEEIRSKAPSADLWIGQTDEGELGFTYADVDRLLIRLVDGRCSIEECIEAGFERQFVIDVIELIRKTQFKRSLPPIAKLSAWTAGFDVLPLEDWEA